MYVSVLIILLGILGVGSVWVDAMVVNIRKIIRNYVCNNVQDILRHMLIQYQINVYQHALQITSHMKIIELVLEIVHLKLNTDKIQQLVVFRNVDINKILMETIVQDIVC